MGLIYDCLICGKKGNFPIGQTPVCDECIKKSEQNGKNKE